MYVHIDKLSKIQLLELDTCFRCALCARFCPVYEELADRDTIPGGRISLLSKLVKKQRGILRLIFGPQPISPEDLERIHRTLYRCTLCGRCMEVCASPIRIHPLWETFRSIIYDAGYCPQQLALIARRISEKGNPYGSDPELRTFWIDRFGFEAPAKEKAKVVYFVGCTSALKSQSQSIAYAISSILNHIGEDWTLLGEREICCGSPSLMIGDEGNAVELAKRNVELIESIEATEVLTGCPSCYRVMRFRYPKLIMRSMKFRVSHITELIYRALEDGRISIRDRITSRVAYHDPCELARLCRVIEDPRKILKAIAENLVELPENKAYTRCCGGGGLLQAVDDELRTKIAQRRIKQAEEEKAEIFASACPACKLTLIDAAKAMGSDIEVLDLAELVAQSLGLM